MGTRINANEAKRLRIPGVVRTKYNIRRVEYQGQWFDSPKERDRFIVLQDMQARGEITNLETHPKYWFVIKGRDVLTRSDRYPNGRRTGVTFDFRYCKPGVGIVIEDVKGRATKEETAYKLRKAIFECLYYPVKVVEI